MADTDNFDLISQHISRLLGLHFSERQLEGMGRNVMKAAMDLKRDPQPDSLQKWLAAGSLSGSELDALARHLSVGETYFFRESKGLDLFKNEIIPGFIKQDPTKEIRIWSAGCSSGEEPYTLAMLLHERIPDFQNRNIRIIASDFNADALNKARNGRYTAWSYRETPESYKKKYFRNVGKHFEIRNEIRQMVTFFQLNLAKADYPSIKNDTDNLDVIFCRNVLMYFMPEMAIQVANRFYQALKQDGWLITSQVELHEAYYAAFQKVRYQQGVFYRKCAKVDKIRGKPESAGIQSAISNKEKVWLHATEKRKASPALKKTIKKVSKVNILKDKASTRSAQYAVKLTELQTTIKKAEELFQAANYGACSELCLAFLKNKPFNKELGALLVQSLANLGKHEQARNWGEKLIDAEGENTTYLNLFATILMEMGNLQLAEKTLIKILYLDPNHAAALFNMHMVLKALEKNKLAKKYFNNLLSVIDQLDDHSYIPGLEDITAGVVRSMIKSI